MTVQAFFDINNVFFTFLGYPMSYLEFFGTVLNIACVYLVAKKKIWNWPIGIAAVSLYAVLFYQIQLYSDFLEQFYYLATGFYGWWVWNKVKKETKLVSRNSKETNIVTIVSIILGTLALGAFISRLHLFFPGAFPEAAAYPYLDALTTVMSFAAQILLIMRRIENWYLWIVVDVIGIWLYNEKEVKFVALLYFIFLLICLNGLYAWRKELREKKEGGSYMTNGTKGTRGFIVGKFLPPHRGHKYLIDTALHYVDDLTVAVCDKESDFIPATLRAKWLREIHPRALVVVMPDIGKDDDSKAWAEYTQEFLGYTPDIVFTSEDYGEPWAKYLGSKHVLVDKNRVKVPISATLVRSNPYTYWEYLEPQIRAYFVKRVAIVGAESSGKTTLARALAKHFNTAWVPEFGRLYSEGKFAAKYSNVWQSQEFSFIADEQNRLEDALARSANKFLFADTNALATAIWHERYMGGTSKEVEQFSVGRAYDMYFLLKPDIPFVDDGLRDGEHIRGWMYERFIETLEAKKIPYAVLGGSADERVDQAEKLLRERFPETFAQKETRELGLFSQNFPCLITEESVLA